MHLSLSGVQVSQGAAVVDSPIDLSKAGRPTRFQTVDASDSGQPYLKL